MYINVKFIYALCLNHTYTCRDKVHRSISHQWYSSPYNVVDRILKCYMWKVMYSNVTYLNTVTVCHKTKTRIYKNDPFVYVVIEEQLIKLTNFLTDMEFDDRCIFRIYRTFFLLIVYNQTGKITDRPNWSTWKVVIYTLSQVISYKTQPCSSQIQLPWLDLKFNDCR